MKFPLLQPNPHVLGLRACTRLSRLLLSQIQWWKGTEYIYSSECKDACTLHEDFHFILLFLHYIVEGNTVSYLYPSSYISVFYIQNTYNTKSDYKINEQNLNQLQH